MEKILDANLKEINKVHSEKKRTAVKQKGVPLHHTQNISVIIYCSDPWLSVCGAHIGNLRHVSIISGPLFVNKKCGQAFQKLPLTSSRAVVYR